MQTLERFEHDAMLRAQQIGDNLDGFDHVYLKTDAVLADAEVAKLPPVYFDARIRLGPPSFLIEIRRRLRVACDHYTMSEAYWWFSLRSNFSKLFIFEQVRAVHVSLA